MFVAPSGPSLRSSIVERHLLADIRAIIAGCLCQRQVGNERDDRRRVLIVLGGNAVIRCRIDIWLIRGDHFCDVLDGKNFVDDHLQIQRSESIGGDRTDVPNPVGRVVAALVALLD